MKQCPKCQRQYTDETLNFCLDDGEWLLDGPGAVEEPKTAILHSTKPPSEAPTKLQIHTTEQTEVLPGGAEAEPRERSADLTEKQSFSANRAAKPLVLLVAAVVILVGGFFGYRSLSSSGKQITAVAVMPFVNESGDPQVEYLSDGMTDMLISSLSELPNIKVKARTSIFRYKGKEIDPKAVGRELGVQAIVNGRVAQRDGRTGISLEVVDTETEDVIFSTRYDKPQSELVTLQSDIARDVSGKLKSKLSGAEETKVTKTYTADPEAYQLYLSGLSYWHKRGRDNLLRATEYFNKAIQKDPNYALAYAGLSLTYELYPLYGISSPGESYPKSKATAMRALELDESVTEAHAALAEYYRGWEWDYARSEKEYRRAIELNPNYATAHQWLGSELLVNLGRFDEAIAEGKRAQELDPFSAVTTSDLGRIYFFARRTDEAIEMFRRAQEIDPTLFLPHLSLGIALSAKGQFPEAIASLRRAVELSNGGPFAKGSLAYALARAGQRDAALKLVEEIKSQAASGELVYPYIALGNKDNAFVWLEKAVDEHGEGLPGLGVDPVLDDLRPDPRFKALLKRMNLPE